ncbi:MAG: hypothetical protein E7069_12090 [Bacteroidales bacterium]|nr:hypothetical protein [Bacteroidales bacterium]
MISRLVALEQQRLAALGYNSVVTPISLRVDKSIKNIALGNDTYILTGVRLSDADVSEDRHIITLVSATDGFTASQRDISLMGQAVYKTLRSFLVIRTAGNEAWEDGASIPPYTLDFIKITPIPNPNTIVK